MTPELSIVVPVRNGEAFLPDLFASLDAQALPRERFEVVFVDNRSTDRTAELLADWTGRAENRRVVSAHGVGPAHARNVGVRHARGRWIVFTDCDTLPEPEWLEAYAAAASANGCVAFEGAVDAWPEGAAGPHTHQVSNKDGGRYVTANMAYRRDLLERLGGFDERFEQPFLEDSELAFRVLDSGAHIVFLPGARVRHRVIKVTTGGVFRASRRIRWLPLLQRRHPARFEHQLGQTLKPLSRVDAEVLAGVLAAPLALASRGPARIAFAAIAAAGIARAAGRAHRTASTAHEFPRHLFLSIALPPWKAAWWLEGRLRFRHIGG